MRKYVIPGIWAAAVLWVSTPVALFSAEKSEFDTRNIEHLQQGDAVYIKFVREHAKRGDKRAQCSLGQFYAIGAYVPQDYDKAARYLVDLGYRHCGTASILLGLMYRDGLGVEKDLEKSKFWFRRGTFSLENSKLEDFLLPVGVDIAREIEEAQAWHARLFDKADPQTQYEEALKYLSGDGVPADPVVAYKLLSKPVLEMIPGAMYELGKGYLHGPFPPGHVQTGLQWLYFAARGGVVLAEKELAIWYGTHATRQRDNFKAYFWLRHAGLTESDLGPLAAEITSRVSEKEKYAIGIMLKTNSFPAA